MSRNHARRARAVRRRGPSLAAGAFTVLVAVLVASAPVAAAVAVATPGTGPTSGAANHATVGSSGASLDAVSSGAPGAPGASPGAAIQLDSSSSAESLAERTGSQPVDVVFVFDRSKSMNKERYELAGEMKHFQRTLIEEGVDARFGLVTYTDSAKVRQPLTGNFQSVVDAMQFQSEGNVERASDAVLEASEMSFREDAERVYVVVTDEDDDSTAEMRQRAIDELGAGTFIAVSPGYVEMSACDSHTQPCDNSSTNELKTYANSLDAHWIPIGTSGSEAMTRIALIVADAAETAGSAGNTGDGDAGDESERTSTMARSVDAGPNVSVVDREVNRMDAEIGDRVTVNATLRNTGLVEGSIDVYVTSDGRVLERQTFQVPHRSERTVTLPLDFDEPGEYTLVLNNERVETVTVTEPRPPSVSVMERPERNRLFAQVSDATAKFGVDVDVPPGLLPMAGGDLERITVTPKSNAATPIHDVRFDLAAQSSTVPPETVPELSTDASRVTYLTVVSTLGTDEFSSVDFQFANAYDDLQVYRYDRETDEWVALDQRTMPDESLAATTSELSTFAVAIEDPVVTVESVDVEGGDVTVGESVSATVTVRNRGSEPRPFDATIALDGAVVSTERVLVAPGETADVTVEHVTKSTGEYALDVAGTDQGQLRVGSAPAADQEPNTASDGSDADATESPAVADVEATTDAGATDETDGFTPGFVAILAVLGLVGLSVYAARRP